MSQIGDQEDWLEMLMEMQPLSEREKIIARNAMNWKCAEIDPETWEEDYNKPEIAKFIRTIKEDWD